MKYNTCPYCGDHLDFGERCDCQQERGAAEAGTAARREKNTAGRL